SAASGHDAGVRAGRTRRPATGRAHNVGARQFAAAGAGPLADFREPATGGKNADSMTTAMIVTWLKFVHVGSIALWSAGLIALPFLFRQRRGLDGEALQRLHAFTRFFYVNLVSPGAYVAVGSGTVLILMQGTYANWFSAKLLAVSAMTGIHIFS